MTDSTAPRLHVQALSADCAEAARRWAERLGLPLAADDEAEFAVQVGEQGWQVLQLGANSPGPVRVEGLDQREWVLMDYGAFVVHVFQQEQRDFYQLERLWGDRPRVGWEPLTPHPESA